MFIMENGGKERKHWKSCRFYNQEMSAVQILVEPHRYRLINKGVSSHRSLSSAVCFGLWPDSWELGYLIFETGRESDPLESSIKFNAEVEAEPVNCKHGYAWSRPSALLLPPKRGFWIGGWFWSSLFQEGIIEVESYTWRGTRDPTSSRCLLLGR